MGPVLSTAEEWGAHLHGEVMIKEAIAKVIQRNDLSETEAIEVMTEIMTGQATEAQIASVITALRMKGETIDEITGCAKVMREYATAIRPRCAAVDIERDEINLDRETIIDTCGTGGDKTNTFNVSTSAAFIAAGAGLRVAKHGNRAVSSQCGSADVLSALGVNLEVTPQKVEECIDAVGIGFLYAPLLHGAMKYAIGPRRQIGIRTIFNILGPLTNPAGARAQVVGVYEARLTEVLARVLGRLGSERAFVVHGKDAMDEISITGETQISELKNGRVETYSVSPEDFGLRRTRLEDISGGNADDNAGIIRRILDGEKGPRRDIACLNAAAAIVAGGKARSIKEGLMLAYAAIDSGKAKEKLEKLVEMTNQS